MKRTTRAIACAACLLFGAPVVAHSAGAPVNLLANSGFESGRTTWLEFAITGFTTIITNDAGAAHLGSWSALLGVNTPWLVQDTYIPPSATTAYLQFWYRIETDEISTSTAYDTLTVKLYNDFGAPIATLATLSNLDATPGWVQSPAYDVSAYKGGPLSLSFISTLDSSRPTSFHIDDVTLGADLPNYTALWWNPNESGWGLNVNQQGNNMFATLFTYDAAGNAMWLVSNGVRSGCCPRNDSFIGDLYRTTGPAFSANPFTPIGSSNITQVGRMTLVFLSDSTGTLSYTVNGVMVNEAIQKMHFGTHPPTCQNSASDRLSLTNYQDLWWNPSESGWGVNITHEDDTLVATLFTYDAAGVGTSNAGLWLVSTATRQSDGSYLGDLLRVTGPPFNATPFTPIGPGNITTVGTMRFRFMDGTMGTLDYTVNGASVTKTITRQVFSMPLPVCTS